MEIERRSVDNHLGVFLQKMREFKGFRLKDVSKTSGISASYLSRIEKGIRRKPSYGHLRKISQAYEVNLDILLDKLSYGEDRAEFNSDFPDILTLDELLMTNEFSIKDSDIVDMQTKNKMISLIESFFNPSSKGLYIDLFLKVADFMEAEELSENDEMRFKLEILELVKKLRETD